VGGDPTGPALAALAGAGATIVDDPVPDVRDEALEITRRYWRRVQLTGEEHMRFLWDWDRFRRRMLVALAGIDVLVAPAAEQVAPPWRESAEEDYRWTLPWSLTGAPVVVVPVGTRDGLPVAVQVIGRPWQDHVALAAARLVEACVPASTPADPVGERA
jgi:amidase